MGTTAGSLASLCSWPIVPIDTRHRHKGLGLIYPRWSPAASICSTSTSSIKQVMKPSLLSATIPLLTASAVRAQSLENTTVFTTFPVSTISSCPPTQIVYTTAYPQPEPSAPFNFVPVTYTITEQCPCTADTRTGIPPGFTTAVVTIEQVTTTVTCPAASINGYVDSGYMSQPQPTETATSGSYDQAESISKGSGSSISSSNGPQSSTSTGGSRLNPDASDIFHALNTDGSTTTKSFASGSPYISGSSHPTSGSPTSSSHTSANSTTSSTMAVFTGSGSRLSCALANVILPAAFMLAMQMV
jgi:hypothetical protein